jgi:hypothetical protein
MESRTGRSTFRDLRSGTLRNLVGEDNKSAVGTGCVRVLLTRIVLSKGAVNSRVPTIPITLASAKKGNHYSPIQKHFGIGNVSSSNSSLD